MYPDSLSPVEVLNLLMQQEVARYDIRLHPILARLIKRSTRQTQINWPVKFQGAASVGESINADVNDFSSDEADDASLPIGTNRLRSSFNVNDVALTQALATGVNELSNLFEVHFQDAVREILEALANEIYNGTGATADGGVIGMLQAAGGAGTTYAGISQATRPQWMSIVDDNGGVARALDKRMFDLMDIDIRMGQTLGVPSNYTAIYAGPNTALEYEELFDSLAGHAGAGAGETVDISYGDRAYKGRPIIEDPDCPEGQLFFVNEPEITLWTFDQPGTLPPGRSTDQRSALNILMNVAELARTNPDARKYAVVCKPQLQVRRRAAIARITDIAVG